MTLEANVLPERSVRRTPRGYEVALHLAWYRSLPLSCIEDIRVTVAGTTVPRDAVRLLRDGLELTLDELADRVDDEWFVQDPLTVLLPDPAPLAAGSQAEVEVNVATRIPYIIIGPGQALVQCTRVHRKVVIQ